MKRSKRHVYDRNSIETVPQMSEGFTSPTGMKWHSSKALASLTIPTVTIAMTA
jgi:hypothetical protein